MDQLLELKLEKEVRVRKEASQRRPTVPLPLKSDTWKTRPRDQRVPGPFQCSSSRSSRYINSGAIIGVWWAFSQDSLPPGGHPHHPLTRRVGSFDASSFRLYTSRVFFPSSFHLKRNSPLTPAASAPFRVSRAPGTVQPTLSPSLSLFLSLGRS